MKNYICVKKCANFLTSWIARVKSHKSLFLTANKLNDKLEVGLALKLDEVALEVEVAVPLGIDIELEKVFVELALNFEFAKAAVEACVTGFIEPLGIFWDTCWACCLEVAVVPCVLDIFSELLMEDSLA